MKDSASPDLETISSERIHAAVPHPTPTTTSLSIIDASVARFTPCGAIWYFPSLGGRDLLDPNALRTSLSHTLSSYPQWTGQLRMTPYIPGLSSRKNAERFGRMEVRYGQASDPGVAFVVAKVNTTLDDALPGHGSKSDETIQTCDGMMRENVLLPRIPLAGLASHPEHEDVSVAVQITRFACGGTAVGVQMAHCLADATALSRFVHDWSASHAALISHEPLPELNPVFEPWALDQRGAASLDDTTPDKKVLERAYELPLWRHDWWASAENSGFGPAAHQIPELLREENGAKEIAVNGEKMPWSTYDTKAAVSHAILHYTSSQLDAIWNAASTPNSDGNLQLPISRHDALVAHVWTLVNRARGPENGDPHTRVHADISFGLRTRVSPPLHPSFLGSPLQIAKVSLAWADTSSTSNLPSIASAIKSTLGAFTPEAVGAQIYALAHELAPQRLWQAFLGREHMLVTSWAHTGLYECAFGTGEVPRHVHPIMPFVDGCVQIMEGRPEAPGWEAKKWYSDGVDVAVYLEREALRRLMSDECVWL